MWCVHGGSGAVVLVGLGPLERPITHALIASLLPSAPTCEGALRVCWCGAPPCSGDAAFNVWAGRKLEDEAKIAPKDTLLVTAVKDRVRLGRSKRTLLNA